MNALVTGVAGFIGSTLADRLVRDRWYVRGIDNFTAYYAESIKRSNLSRVGNSKSFTLIEVDLLTAELEPILDDIDVVFHLAGQPGVRLSWADGFQTYNEVNVNVTQRLLEAARGKRLRSFVYASSSSVYGNAPIVPTDEAQPTRPYSPYGVTKLAGELLCSAYGANFGVPTVSLRYFTVYGPRQRPDMALNRMIQAALGRRRFPLFGDGEQIRDFTFVDDIVEITIRAGIESNEPGTFMNAAGGSSVSMNTLVEMVGEAVGHDLIVEHCPSQAGDVRATGGAILRAEQLLGWSPVVSLGEGIARQLEWHREDRSGPRASPS